jgi:hypothetical protein
MEKAEMRPLAIIQAAESEGFQKLLNQGTKSKKLGTRKYTLHKDTINSFINDNSKKPQAITLTQPAKVTTPTLPTEGGQTTTAEALYENIGENLYTTPEGIPAAGRQTTAGESLYAKVELGAGSGEIIGVADEPLIYSGLDENGKLTTLPAKSPQTITGDPLYSEVELGAGSGKIIGGGKGTDQEVLYSTVRPAESRNSIPATVKERAQAIGQNALDQNRDKSETKEDPTTRTRSATPPLPPK